MYSNYFLYFQIVSTALVTEIIKIIVLVVTFRDQYWWAVSKEESILNRLPRIHLMPLLNMVLILSMVCTHTECYKLPNLLTVHVLKWAAGHGQKASFSWTTIHVILRNFWPTTQVLLGHWSASVIVPVYCTAHSLGCSEFY